MPIDCQIDSARRSVTVTATGGVTIDEWAACIAEQIRANAWTFRTLFDFTNVESLPPVAGIPKMVDDIAEVNREHGRRGPIAFLVKPAMLERIRYYQDLASELPYQIEVFTDSAGAYAWLDSVNRQVENRNS